MIGLRSILGLGADRGREDAPSSATDDAAGSDEARYKAFISYNHPDDVGVARIVTAAPPGSSLWFNYANPRNARWNDPHLGKRYTYSARYPAADAAGVTIELPVSRDEAAR